MQIQQSQMENVLIVRPLEKRIDAVTASEFKEKMSDWIGAGNRRIVLNLSEVDFIDSSALGAIVSSLKKIGTEGDLVICMARETVMSLFRLTRMNRVFSIFPSEEEAVRSLSGKV